MTLMQVSSIAIRQKRMLGLSQLGGEADRQRVQSVCGEGRPMPAFVMADAHEKEFGYVGLCSRPRWA